MGAIELEREKQLDLQKQFKDAIQSISSSLNIGYSLENAVIESKRTGPDLSGECQNLQGDADYGPTIAAADGSGDGL